MSWLDPDFWFLQPATLLTGADLFFGYLFAALIVLALLLWIGGKFLKHQVVKKLWRRFFSWTATSGLVGALWFGLRFENTPIFGKRFLVGLILLLSLAWLLWILKFALFTFPKAKREYEQALLKNKYLT